MQIVINNTYNQKIDTITFENLDNIEETFKRFSSFKGSLEAKIFSINESISSHKLSKIKNNFDQNYNRSLLLYSNIRETVLAGKSLKINSTFVQEEELKKKLLLLDTKEKGGILHEGTLRSGDRISSDGNLFIIGDVNPGAIVSAKKNIYVWGKLLGIAFAGRDGNNKASITSLYLNPLQLRIADIVAIGPKEKPKNYYPEIALIEKKNISIMPYIIETKN